MKCLKCGAELEADSKFCVSCGTRVEEADCNTEPIVIPEKTQEVKSKKSDKSKMIRLLVGTVFVLIGIMRIATAGTTISSTSFGADFYTYTYQGIVAVAEQLATIEVSLGWIIVAIGAWIDVSALEK